MKFEKNGVYGLLQKQVEANPEGVAAIIDNMTLSFSQIDKAAEKIAGHLHASGVRPGDNIGVILPSSKAWIYAFWGIAKMGAVMVPFAPGTGRAEIENVFKVLSIKACFTVPRFQANEWTDILQQVASVSSLNEIIVDGDCQTAENQVGLDDILAAESQWHAVNLPTIQDDSLFAFMCTSGTTGVPKIIPKYHNRFIEYLNEFIQFFPHENGKVFFTTMPPFHMLSLSYLLLCMMKGSAFAFQKIFDPHTMLETLNEYSVNTVLLSATNAKILLSDGAFDESALTSVKSILFSGEFCPDEVAAEFHEKRNFRVQNIMGSTEASAYLLWDSAKDKGSSVSVLTPPEFVQFKVLSDNGDECAIGERGEIFISHMDVISEYYKNSKTSEESIVKSETGTVWFVTGDMCIPLPEGRFQFAGRKKRIIKRGAVLIYPEEIESFLMTHPEINAAAILKQDDVVTGERMKAFVELKADSNLTVKEIIQFCQGQLANNKIPDKIEIIDEIPRETGKVQFKKLRQL